MNRRDPLIWFVGQCIKGADGVPLEFVPRRLKILSPVLVGRAVRALPRRPKACFSYDGFAFQSTTPNVLTFPLNSELRRSVSLYLILKLAR